MHEVKAKSILSARNGMNLYRGCSHGCIYCDSRSTCYGMDHAFEDIEVKINGPELLEQALRRRRKRCMIGTGAMCDPYMPAERSLGLTRKCLEIIEHYGFGVSILTKSDLILRDLDLLKRINQKTRCVVQMTLTTCDEDQCRIIEPHVCTTSRRAQVLEIMRDEGIPAIIWMCPILPFINDTEENIQGIIEYGERARVHGILAFDIGETGAGKTTLALSLMRLLPKVSGRITGGEIMFNGEDLVKAAEEDMRKVRGEKISMIFQDPMTSLNPVLTVGNQIGEALELHMDLTPEEKQERIEEMLKLVGIAESRKKDYPHQFSGGMKQRVVIAMALACKPELLLADEPTTALDVTIQAQILDMMQELKEKINTSIILITHDLGIVAEICDKVAIMYAGEIIEYGTAEDIYEGKNRHPYTEGLFGSIPDLEVESRRLNPIDGLMPDPTDLPPGCKFHPRCPKCMDICKNAQPPECVEGTHMIRCHLYQDGPEGVS